jgi:hypothetical protein
MKQPYETIQAFIVPVDSGCEEAVTFKIDCSNLSIGFDYFGEDDTNMMPLNIDLTFKIEDAIALMDFLNFALPVGK